jgi:RES domain-containing protein
LHQKYAGEPFSGKGGLYASSRWASRGQLVAYAAESLALATLEKIAGVGTLNRLSEMVYVPADLREEDVRPITKSELPGGWDRRPPGAASREVGDRWLRENASVALRVPSVTLPEGSNYVLNPTHPRFEDALTIHAPSPLKLDPRVMKRLRSQEEKNSEDE